MDYIEYIRDFFYAKVKNKKYKVKEVFCMKPFAKCPLTGKRQFWKKSLRIVFDDGHNTIFFCELYEFERYLLVTDFSNRVIFPEYAGKVWY